MPSVRDPRLLEPLVLVGPAVDRDRQMKDKDDAPKSIEQEWIDIGHRVDAAISALEVQFFDELKRRSVS
jgi:hypothetical protein